MTAGGDVANSDRVPWLRQEGEGGHEATTRAISEEGPRFLARVIRIDIEP